MESNSKNISEVCYHSKMCIFDYVTMFIVRTSNFQHFKFDLFEQLHACFVSTLSLLPFASQSTQYLLSSSRSITVSRVWHFSCTNFVRSLSFRLLLILVNFSNTWFTNMFRFWIENKMILWNWFNALYCKFHSMELNINEFHRDSNYRHNSIRLVSTQIIFAQYNNVCDWLHEFGSYRLSFHCTHWITTTLHALIMGKKTKNNFENKFN